MTITSEERELLDMLHKAMPERKNLMLITLTAGAHLDGITEFELPQCSRAAPYNNPKIKSAPQGALFPFMGLQKWS